MDQQLQTLIELQGYDARIAALEAETARLPKQIEAIQQGLAESKKTVEALKAKSDTSRKDLRAKEKDLEVTASKRAKADAKLWEVKTNKEYSAALLEIEAIKQEKAQSEEEILTLMEGQEHLAGELKQAEARYKEREAQARQDEAVIKKKLEAVEAELTGVRGERNTRARELPQGILTDYERILKARAGIAVAHVNASAICGGCRVSIRPQALQELRVARELMRCESCGRYLYWQE